MTQDDIIKMARQHADEVTNGYGVTYYEFDLYGLEKFALLIRAAERERIIAANAPEIEKVNGYIKALEDASAPPQRDEAPAKAVEWQGLTDEEMFSLWVKCPAETEDRFAFARAIEAQLKGKNT